eukprot:4982057-Alexandrium_andersonii.AAC.2
MPAPCPPAPIWDSVCDAVIAGAAEEGWVPRARLGRLARGRGWDAVLLGESLAHWEGCGLLEVADDGAVSVEPPGPG